MVAYLSRDERREQIIKAVVDIVSREGLAAATVRRIAQELGISRGQIHHHFASAEVLRAEAIREVWRRIEPAMMSEMRRLTPRERLLALLPGCDLPLGEDLAPIGSIAERLWREALDIRGEPAVREAIAEGLVRIKAEIVAALKDGVESGVFPQTIEIESAALRLVAASQGFDLLQQIMADEDLAADRLVFVEGLLRNERL